jgi:hypothetical protein
VVSAVRTAKQHVRTKQNKTHTTNQPEDAGGGESGCRPPDGAGPAATEPLAVRRYGGSVLLGVVAAAVGVTDGGGLLVAGSKPSEDSGSAPLGSGVTTDSRVGPAVPDELALSEDIAIYGGASEKGHKPNCWAKEINTEGRQKTKGGSGQENKKAQKEKWAGRNGGARHRTLGKRRNNDGACVVAAGKRRRTNDRQVQNSETKLTRERTKQLKRTQDVEKERGEGGP